jgi:hypothetical protein
MLAALLALGALLMPAAATAHSHAALDARFEVQGAQVDATMRLGLRDLRHMVQVDRDGDGGMSPAEIEAARPALERYLARALKLELSPDGQPCRLELEDTQLVDLGSVDAHLRFTCPRPGQAFTLSAGLFGGTGHTFDLHARFIEGDLERRVALSSRHNSVEVTLVPAPPAVRWRLIAGAIGLGALIASFALWVVLRRAARS